MHITNTSSTHTTHEIVKLPTTIVRKEFTVENFHAKNICVEIFSSPWTADKNFLSRIFWEWEQCFARFITSATLLLSVIRDLYKLLHIF